MYTKSPKTLYSIEGYIIWNTTVYWKKVKEDVWNASYSNSFPHCKIIQPVHVICQDDLLQGPQYLNGYYWKKY